MPYADPAEAKAYHARKYRENCEAIKARVKKRAEEKADEIREYSRLRYQENKEQISLASRLLREQNGDEIRKVDRDRHAKNPEIKRATDRQRYQRDKEKRKALAREYSKNNPDVRYYAQQKRRALKAGAKVERVLRADILDRDGPNCALCGTETILPVRHKPVKSERHYDHIIPLCRGGSHSMGNMRILCAACNLKKHTRLDSEFLNEMKCS